MNVYCFLNISKISKIGQYTMVVHHEQCMFIIYDSAGRRRRSNFQQLPKLIEIKFISTT